MSNENANLTKVIVPCRFSYLHCWEPNAVSDGDPKYSVSAIIPKSDTETMLIPTTGAMESITSSGNGGNGNASLAARLDAMYEVVTKYLPRLANSQVVLDSGVLVGELSDGLNRELGKAYS